MGSHRHFRSARRPPRPEVRPARRHALPLCQRGSNRLLEPRRLEAPVPGPLPLRRMGSRPPRTRLRTGPRTPPIRMAPCRHRRRKGPHSTRSGFGDAARLSACARPSKRDGFRSDAGPKISTSRGRRCACVRVSGRRRSGPGSVTLLRKAVNTVADLAVRQSALGRKVRRSSLLPRNKDEAVRIFLRPVLLMDSSANAWTYYSRSDRSRPCQRSWSFAPSAFGRPIGPGLNPDASAATKRPQRWFVTGQV